MTDVKKTEIAKREEEVLAFWNKNNIFEKSVTQEAPQGDYVFYDGPPFATGTPHYGHLIASSMKDAVPRYWTMRGYRVERQWGWDCHGLPIENIVEKELGTKSKRDIVELGIKKFNDLCREKIFTYADVWDEFIPRFGRWADMSKPYRTMDKDYMESEWWAFKTLHDKGLIYEDYRSMHICPRCETTLAQSEVAEGYTDIKDLSVTTAFPLVDEPSTSVLAWTTTPWTLPGNVALAVGSAVTYSVVESDGKKYILAKERIEDVFKDKNHSVVSEIKGSELVGKSYIPPFDSYVHDEHLPHKENAWKIYAADFVTTDTGTGIAHEAPAFGAEDMELAQAIGLPMIQHVGMDGIIKPEVKELAGLSVKPAGDHQATDVEVVKYLAGKGILFSKEKYEHSYPHCWRCDTPLINYATSSWFVAVEKIKENLLKNAENINWSPAHIKKGRWGEWLKGARDWSISRQRFWANTIPVWRCEGCNADRVFGAVADLEEASGTKVEDLHKDVVDEVVVPCACGGEMRRVPDVLDTWFNSGSVPYASYHYPFENEEKVGGRIPADFIAEGIDQVSKWFYYQHVLSGGLFEGSAFKNVIANGIVLAEDGKKMSKRLLNYPDPIEVIDKYGADAVRLYMLTSPVVRAENLNFSEQGVAEVSRKVLGRLTNVYEFFALVTKGNTKAPHDAPKAQHPLDVWVIARTHQLQKEVTSAMDNYELDRATRPIGEFVDDLSTWYVRRSRDRLKEDATGVLVLAWVLKEVAKVMAPFAPFHADWLWQRVREEEGAESVHLARWGEPQEVNEASLKEMELVRTLVSEALEARSAAGIKVRQPLQTLSIRRELNEALHDIIKEEINVKEVVSDSTLTNEIALDTTITPELQKEGDVRDLIRLIQSARKEAALAPGESAKASLHAPQVTLDLAETHKHEILKLTAVELAAGEVADETSVVIAKG